MATRAKSKSVTRQNAQLQLNAIRSVKQSLGRLRARLEKLADESKQLSVEEVKEELKLCVTQERRLLRVILDEGLSTTMFLSWLEGIDESKIRLRRALRSGRASRIKLVSASSTSALVEMQPKTNPQTAIDEINRLYLRMSGLRSSLRQNSIQNAEKELKKCKVHGSNIEIMIQAQRLDASYFFTQFQSIHEILIDIEDDIERLKNVWWRRAMKGLVANVGKFIPSVAKLFGIPLPSGQKLLSFETRDK